MNHDPGCYSSAGVGSQTHCTIHDCFNTNARPVRLPHAHPGRPSRGETTPRLASSNKKESVDATIISSSFLVSAEVERMAHWSAYGSRVFSSPGSIFARLIHSAFTMTHRRGIEPRSIIGETRVYYWSVVRSSYLSFPRVREPGRLSEPALYRSFLEIHYSPPRDCERSLTRPQTTRLEIRPY